MRSAYYVLVAIMLTAVTITTASADPVLARELAMGLTHVGLADGPNAFLANPAGLPALADFNDGLKSAAAVSARVDNEDGDAWSALYSAASGSKPIGWGAGFWEVNTAGSETDFFAVGFGGRLVRTGELTGGLTMINASVSAGQNSVTQAMADDDVTSLNVGLMYLLPVPSSVRLGAVVNDVTDELPGDVTVDVGASVLLPEGLLLAVDVNDVADEVDTTVNVGAEYQLPRSGVVLRAGAADGDFTFGAGYRWDQWELSGGWADLDSGELGVASFSVRW